MSIKNRIVIKGVLIGFGILALSNNQSIYSENAAKDTGAKVANIVRELQTSVAENNKQIRDAQKESEASFAQIQQLSPLSSKMEIPKISTTEDNGSNKASGNTASAELLTDNEESNIDKEKEKYDSLLKQHRELAESIRVEAKNYSELDESSKKKVDEKMQTLVDISDELNKAPIKYVTTPLGRPDFYAVVDRLATQLDGAGKDKLSGLKTSKTSETPKNQDSGSTAQKTEPELEVKEKELTGIDLVRSKCSGSVGAKNGAALVKHLTSGDCGKALDSNPDLKAEYNIKRIVELIAAWGFRTASFDAKANQAIGLNKLPELGLILDYKAPKSEFKAVKYQPAVEVQQSQILTTSEDNAGGPLSLIGNGASRDKASLQHSSRD